MDILWGEHEDRPEGAAELNAENLKEVEGDLLLIHPMEAYSGGPLRPKSKHAKWVESWPNKKFISHLPLMWANHRVKTRVGVLAGFDYDLSYHLAVMGISGRAEVINAAANIAILNGPNLNLLGEREPEVYGSTTLEQIFNELKIIAPETNFVFRQTNSEGEMVTLIQKLRHESDAIIINAGAYTHTSVAVHDALKSFDDQIIELHISNPHQREKFRKTSYIAPTANAYVAGFGVFGYKMALTGALMRL